MSDVRVEAADKTRFIPVSDWEKHHVWPSTSSMRHLVYDRTTNGFDEHGVVKRVGRRVLIDEAAFQRWVNAQPGNEVKGAA